MKKNKMWNQMQCNGKNNGKSQEESNEKMQKKKKNPKFFVAKQLWIQQKE